MAVSSTTVTGAVPADPAHVAQGVRKVLAEQLLHGSGIEIGALHLPLIVPNGVTVRYVDRMTVPDLRAHYPELRELPLVPVDLVDDGELLSTIADESIDFIIANHFLEHCEDPIRTIETHLAKLRPGGVLFYAVPDKRHTFDVDRARTLLSHVVADHENGPNGSRRDHYREWVAGGLEGGPQPQDWEDVISRAAALEAAAYSIHFHVWTQADFLELMVYCRERWDSFEIEAARSQWHENIAVLRKHADRPAAIKAPSRESATSAPTPGSQGRIPLSALRAQLDEGSAGAHWSVDVGDIPGRALVQLAGPPVTIPLHLTAPASLRARAMLVHPDRRDGTGSVRVWVGVSGPWGLRRRLWSGTLATAEEHGRPEGVAIDCRLPSWTQAVLLNVEQRGRPGARSVARAVWVEPEIIEPSFAVGVRPALTVGPASPVGRLRNSAPGAGRDSSAGPFISVLTPVHNPPLEVLEQTLASVLSQTFTAWELCLVDDGSTDPNVVEALRDYSASDARIQLLRREHAGGIATATNAALDMARGEYVALLDHDDALDPDALGVIAARLEADPQLDMVYTDEDIVDVDGRRIWLHLKPGWSPETICTSGYTCHLGVYRRSLVREVGGFRPDLDGSQDYDFILRLIERTDRIAHVPGILYHWRSHGRSTAGGGDVAKPYAYVAAREAIAEHFDRSGIAADVQFSPPGLYRVVHRVDPSLTASLIISGSSAEEFQPALSAAARSWLAQCHPTWEVVIAGSSKTASSSISTLLAAGVDRSRIVTVSVEDSASVADALNAGASAARSEHLVLLDGPAVGLTDDWLRRLLGYSSQPGIGAAGPLVVAPNGQITQAGNAIVGGFPLYLLHGANGTSIDDFFGFGTAVFNVSAVDGVLATAREAFELLGGLRPAMESLALVDYCLRARQAQLRVVTVPDARLRRLDRRNASNDLATISRFRQAWQASFPRDPYYHPGYRQDRGDFSPGAQTAERDIRDELAAEFLRGHGMAIRTPHLPMSLPAGVAADAVDDGQLRSAIADESLDFLFASRLLEHCEDPIRAIEAHLAKLGPGGVLFYGVSDQRYTSDAHRPRTPLSHVIADHEDGPERSRREHYQDWVRMFDAGYTADELEALRFPIRFHVWTQADLLELMIYCRERFDNFDMPAVRRYGADNLVVVRKRDDPVSVNGSDGAR